MCGIVGYTGKNNCLPILIEGLRLLEYRGYDSSGISLAYSNRIETVKAKGKLSVLEERLRALELGKSFCGIGHTRWATHGSPSDVNSHPHNADTLTLVHNGIIENHREIEKMLLSEGYEFVSDTDTERAALLIDMLYKRTSHPLCALFEAQELLRGSYAFGIIFKDRPDKIYAMRKDSPLIIGYDANGSYIASDIPAILPYTDSCCRIDEGLVAEISRDTITFYENPNSRVAQKFEHIDWDPEQAQKGGYPHFMLKEINEEPKALRSTVERFVKDSLPDFDGIGDILDGIKDIRIIACGTAMHAGLVGKYFIEKLARIPVTVDIASEFRYSDPILSKHSLVIFLSQSGETADTIAALRKAKELGVASLAIVNVFGSTLAREADRVIYTLAGPEISVASTKAYSVQCAVLCLLAIKLGLTAAALEPQSAAEHCRSLMGELESAIEATLSLSESISQIAQKLVDCEHLFYIGRGIDYCLATEASLKLKEISYIHSEAYAAGELKHGTISLVTEQTPIVAIMTDEKLAAKTLNGVHEVISRGAKIIIICTEAVVKANSLPECELVVLPKTRELLYPFVCATAVQLLAYHTSAKKGLDVDKPRNLAKSVTVE